MRLEELDEVCRLLEEVGFEVGEARSMRLHQPTLDELMGMEEPEELEVLTALHPTPLDEGGGLEVDGFLAVDASSVKLGETPEGVVAACRVAVASLSSRGASLLRAGPYVFHITWNNRAELYNRLRSMLDLGELPASEAPSVDKMVDRARSLVERLFQLAAARSVDGYVLLWDGSLRAGTVDTPMELARRILREASSRGCHVAAFSKTCLLYTSPSPRDRG